MLLVLVEGGQLGWLCGGRCEEEGGGRVRRGGEEEEEVGRGRDGCGL